MHDDKVTFGFWLYIMSDCVLFAGLFAVYAVLRNATYGSIGIEDIVSMPLVLTETFLLLTSSFTVGLALLFAKQHKKNLSLVFFAITLLLGLGFLGLEASEFARLIGEGSGPQGSAFLSAFFTLLGTHGLHVFFGALWMILLMVQVYIKGLSTTNIRRLTCLSLFWHFLDIVWICIFTIVYMFGSL